MGSPPGAPGGTGGAMSPSPMGGSSAQGMTGVKTGVEALQKALPMLPMGSELHTAILKAITDISKHMDQNMGGGPQAVIQQLAQMARDQQQNPQRQAMMSMMSGGGSAAPPAPGGGGGGAPPSPMSIAA